METKVALALGCFGVLVLGGWVASDLVTSKPTASASAATARVGVRTVKRIVTVREQAVVRRVVPVVRTVVSRRPDVTRTETRTQTETQTQTRIQTRTVVPRTSTRLVTTAVVRPVRVLERRTVTVTRTPRAQTVVRTVTGAGPQSTQPPSTVSRTVTQPGPERLVTVTTTEPTTVVRTTTLLETTTRTETLTTTAPPVTSTTTVTVTTTVPRGK